MTSAVCSIFCSRFAVVNFDSCGSASGYTGRGTAVIDFASHTDLVLDLEAFIAFELRRLT